MDWITQVDKTILLTIHEYIENKFFDWLMPIITYIGNLGAIWLAIGLCLLLSKKHRYTGFLTLFSLGLSAFFGEIILKNIIGRPRPFLQIEDISLLIKAPTSFSFPSGHTTASFAAAGILIYRLKNFRFIIIALALLIPFSRLYLMVHFPLDIIGGMIIGSLCAVITVLFFGKIDRCFGKFSSLHGKLGRS